MKNETKTVSVKNSTSHGVFKSGVLIFKASVSVVLCLFETIVSNFRIIEIDFQIILQSMFRTFGGKLLKKSCQWMKHWLVLAVLKVTYMLFV